MTLKMEGPAAWDKANGAEIEADNFYGEEYRICESVATSPLLAVRRVARLVARHGLTAQRAALVDPMIFGEG